MGAALIELPAFPLTEIYTRLKPTRKAGFADQAFHLCPKCGHGQLANVVDVDLVYEGSSHYFFRTSQSAVARESAEFFRRFIMDTVGERRFQTIAEVGCNDLYLLKLLKSSAARLVGIDPILKGKEKELAEDNVVAVGDFFENVTLDSDIDMFICKDTLEHVSGPRRLIERLVSRAGEDTLFFFQFPLLETLLAGCRFDHIFHQHLNYFSLKSIRYMLNDLGCELVNERINISHWGAILIAFRKSRTKNAAATTAVTPDEVLERYSLFRSNMAVTAQRLRLLAGETIYGYGAGLMLPVLAYHLGDDLSSLKCILDDDKRKDGLYYVNLPVRISLPEGADIRDSVVMVTAIASMNNVRAILRRLFDLGPKQIIVPLNNI